MSRLKHVQSAMGWFVVALLLTCGVINLIGFVSPFWTLWRYPGPTGFGRSMDLLHFWQPITCWLALSFVIPAWHLAQALRTVAARVAVIGFGLLVAAAYIAPWWLVSTQPATALGILTTQKQAVMVVSDLVLAGALLIFPALVWHVLKKARAGSAGA